MIGIQYIVLIITCQSSIVANKVYTGDGVLINSGEFSGLNTVIGIHLPLLSLLTL